MGDLAGNAEKMRQLYAEAVRADVDLLAFPELAVCGYPPEDLLHKQHFLAGCSRAVEKLAADCPDTTIVAGFAEGDNMNCYNSAAVLQGGRISGTYRKSLLPNYGVFDERRYFQSGAEALRVSLKDLDVTVTICFDIWSIEWLRDFLRRIGPVHMILNISASPFHTGKIRIREETIGRCAREFNCAVAYCNLVGGQDELIFDGRSMFVDSGGTVVAKDVPKTTVYRLAEHVNKMAGRQVIPGDVITRPPTAELRPGQKDSDSLPEYDLLDRILKGYVEEDKSVAQLVEQGLPKDVVNAVIRLVDRNEYKRRLSPPGIKITPKAFGKDRRLPITNRYRPWQDVT